jgi:hypothetical protein
MPLTQRMEHPLSYAVPVLPVGSSPVITGL